MKIVLLSVLGFAALLGGGSFLVNNNTVNSSTQSTVVTLPASSPTSTNLPTLAKSTDTKQVHKLAVDKTRVLYLNDEVGGFSIVPLLAKIKEFNAKSADPIYLLIDSPGGSVLAGGALVSEMEASKAPIYTVCTALCASMAAIIHSYGTQRYMLDRAILMYHPASFGAQGQVKNVKSLTLMIDSYVEKFVDNIINRSKADRNKFQLEVAYEKWIDAEDSTREGFNDAIVNLNVTSHPQLEQAPPMPAPSEDQHSPTKTFYDVKWIAADHYLPLWKR